MKISAINNNKTTLFVSRCGNYRVMISKSIQDRKVTFFTVSLLFRDKVSGAESTRLLTAYNECVGDMYNQLGIDYQFTEADDFILNVGCILENLSK